MDYLAIKKRRGIYFTFLPGGGVKNIQISPLGKKIEKEEKKKGKKKGKKGEKKEKRGKKGRKERKKEGKRRKKGRKRRECVYLAIITDLLCGEKNMILGGGGKKYNFRKYIHPCKVAYFL